VIRRGTVVGRALRVLGLVAVIVAIWFGGKWALMAAVGAGATAFGLTLNALVKFWSRRSGTAQPTDFTHTLDLLRPGGSMGRLPYPTVAIPR
jgi:hypothetical protein